MKLRKTLIALTLATAAASLPAKQSLAQEKFVGEIIWVGFNFCPRSYTPANGQLLQISQNQALFSLLGTTYGGDGRVTFAVPDLRGRAAIHRGQGPGLSNIQLGGTGGAEQVVLGADQIPSVTHSTDTALPVKEAEHKKDPLTEVSITEVGASSMEKIITTVSDTSNRNPVEIRSPFLGLQACIVVQGIYPARN